VAIHRGWAPEDDPIYSEPFTISPLRGTAGSTKLSVATEAGKKATKASTKRAVEQETKDTQG